MTEPPARISLFRGAAIYTIARVINAAIPFLLLPIMTRYLAPADYGTMAMFAAILAVVNPLVMLGLPSSIAVKYFDKDVAALPAYVGSCVLIALTSAAFLTGALWLLGGPISALTGFPREWLWVVTAVSAAQFITVVVLTLWQAQGKAIPFGLLQIFQTVLNFGMSLVLVVGLERTWRGRIEAQLFTAVVIGGLALVFLWRKRLAKLSFSKPAVVSALRFGVPLVPHELGSILIAQTDRMFIATMLGLADAGIYTVGFQLAMGIEVLASSFNQSFSPWLFGQLSAQPTDATKRTLVKYTYAYFGAILLLAGGVALFIPILLEVLVGKAYAGAAQYVFWLALGFAFSGMYFMVANYIYFARKTALVPAITLTTAALNVGLNYVLITYNGAVGAAQASAAALFINFLLTWVLSARVYKMPWRLWSSPPAALAPGVPR